jgi:hypothetical protein
MNETTAAHGCLYLTAPENHTHHRQDDDGDDQTSEHEVGDHCTALHGNESRSVASSTVPHVVNVGALICTMHLVPWRSISNRHEIDASGAMATVYVLPSLVTFGSLALI